MNNAIQTLFLVIISLPGCSTGNSSNGTTPYGEDDPYSSNLEGTNADQCSGAETMAAPTVTKFAPANSTITPNPFVASDGESVFAKLLVDEKFGLYRLSWDGTNKTLLTSDYGSDLKVLGKDSVFIAADEGLVKIKKDGSQIVTWKRDAYDSIYEMAADDTYVFVSRGKSFEPCTDGGTDYVSAINQETGEETILSNELCGPAEFSSDGTYLYFTASPIVSESQVEQYSSTTLIQRIPRAGGKVETLATLENAYGLALSNGWLYTTVDTNPDVLGAPYTLVRIRTTGGPLEKDENCQGWGAGIYATDTGVLTMYVGQLDFIDADDKQHHLMNSEANIVASYTSTYKNSVFIAGFDGSVTRYDYEFNQ